MTGAGHDVSTTQAADTSERKVAEEIATDPRAVLGPVRSSMRRWLLGLVALLVVLAVTALLSLAIGARDIAPVVVVRALSAALSGAPDGDFEATVVITERLFAEDEAEIAAEVEVVDEAEELVDAAADAEAAAKAAAEANAEAERAAAEADAQAGLAEEPIVVPALPEEAADLGAEPALTAEIETVDIEELETAEEIQVEAVEGDEVSAPAPEDAADTFAPVSANTGTDTAGYSFPDIQPPEEWRSVFDDPSRAATIGSQSAAGGNDFDDLISRAVAQEGSTGGTGTSALILPAHPADTGGLSGPLGATGELFVTGSIELPKSLGETGGHAALHDSVEFDAFLSGDHSASLPPVAESGPMPVSALSAVSARRRPEVPVVAEPTKDRSKLPLVLALSGGGLIVVLAGAVVFAATQGFFG